MLLLTFLVLATARPAPPALDAAHAAAWFAEMRAASDRDGGRLWGRRLYGPMLFVDPDTRRCFADVADTGGALTPDGQGVFTGTVPLTVPLANTALPWSGVTWTMVVAPLPDDPRARLDLMAHECFHRIQASVGLPPRGGLTPSLDGVNGRWLLQLELRALAAALRSDGAARRAALADALLFRASRRAAAPGSAATERALEDNEGLAEYTGTVLSGGLDVAARQRLAQRIAHPNPSASFTRTFAYLTGPAYGLLLDLSGTPWRKRIARPGGPAGLEALAAAAYGLRAGTPGAGTVRAAARRYGGDALLASEEKRGAALRKRVALLRAQFLGATRLVLPNLNARFSFDPRFIVSLGPEGSVYPQMVVAADWGRLDAPDGGLMTPDFKTISVPAPVLDEAGAHGPHWTFHLAPGWRVAPGAHPGEQTVAKAP